MLRRRTTTGAGGCACAGAGGCAGASAGADAGDGVDDSVVCVGCGRKMSHSDCGMMGVNLLLGTEKRGVRIVGEYVVDDDDDCRRFSVTIIAVGGKSVSTVAVGEERPRGVVFVLPKVSMIVGFGCCRSCIAGSMESLVEKARRSFMCGLVVGL